jgi:hypothetical protein
MKKGLLILSAILFAACSKSSNNSTGPTGGNVSFSSDVQPIFTQNCALSGCHATASPLAGNQNLSAGQAYGNIVNVASTEKPNFLRVKPFSSDSSYLYMKITADPRITGVPMPKIGSITPQQKQTIKDWIDQGALNN